MKKVMLGNSNLEVSTLCLGTMYFGTNVDEATSFRLLDQYVEAGGTFLDTANCYAFWTEGGSGDESEALIGRWLKSRGHRDRLVIATKVGCRPSYAGAAYPDGLQGLSRDVIIKDVEASLKRLGVDTIDLYYTHQDDRSVPLEETLEALEQLVAAGNVRHIGCSNMAAWRMEQARFIAETQGYPNYCCAQLRHTFLPGNDTGVQLGINQEHLDYASTHKLSLLAYSPLLQGAYVREDRPVPDAFLQPGYQTRLAALHKVANEVEATANQVVLAWMLQGQPSILPLIAGSTEAQLQDSIASTQTTLSKAQMKLLNKAGSLKESV